MKKIAVSLTLIVLLGAAQARDAVALVEPERLSVAAGQTASTSDLMKQAIVKGSAGYGWTVVGDEPGKVRLKYNKQNKHEVVVDVSYDTTGFLIRYISSTNMKYARVDGVPMIHPFYNNWIRNLGQGIVAETRAPALAR